MLQNQQRPCHKRTRLRTHSDRVKDPSPQYIDTHGARKGKKTWMTTLDINSGYYACAIIHVFKCSSIPTKNRHGLTMTLLVTKGIKSNCLKEILPLNNAHTLGTQEDFVPIHFQTLFCSLLSTKLKPAGKGKCSQRSSLPQSPILT